MWSGVLLLGLIGVALSLLFRLVESWFSAGITACAPWRATGGDAMLSVTGLRKVYDDMADAWRRYGADLRRRRRRTCLLGRPIRLWQDDTAAWPRRVDQSTAGTVHLDDPNVAVVFQEYGRSLFPWLRVRDNVALPIKRVPRAERSVASRRRCAPLASPAQTRRTHGSCPAGCSSGSRSPAPSRFSRGCC